MPPHLCKFKTSLSLLSCSDSNKPMMLVTTADNAAHNQRKCNHSFSLCIGNHSVIKERISNTMGKCKNIGCILPTTCNHEGTCKLFSNAKRKRRNTNPPNKIPSKVFLSICILLFFISFVNKKVLFVLIDYN